MSQYQLASNTCILFHRLGHVPLKYSSWLICIRDHMLHSSTHPTIVEDPDATGDGLKQMRSIRIDSAPSPSCMDSMLGEGEQGMSAYPTVDTRVISPIIGSMLTLVKSWQRPSPSLLLFYRSLEDSTARWTSHTAWWHRVRLASSILSPVRQDNQADALFRMCGSDVSIPEGDLGVESRPISPLRSLHWVTIVLS